MRLERPTVTGNRAISLGIAAAVLWFGVDQFAKWLILEHVMNPPRVISIASFLNIVLGRNTGISFGLFGAAPSWLLTLLTLAILFWLVVWMRRAEDRIRTVAIGLAIGGAVGNIIDRLRYGAVTDFIDIHLTNWHFPAFNLADVGITTAVVLLVATTLFERSHIAGAGKSTVDTI
ncbi:MAG: signal peptidase II [Proteobacteria bacterium]|nr:signal peptidase II [Pseudomonadota bacterium]